MCQRFWILVFKINIQSTYSVLGTIRWVEYTTVTMIPALMELSVSQTRHTIIPKREVFEEFVQVSYCISFTLIS